MQMDVNPTQLVPLTSLRLDLQNPRLETQQGQNQAMAAIVKDQGRKLLRLASDIADHGTNPTELPIVAPQPDGTRLVQRFRNNPLNLPVSKRRFHAAHLCPAILGSK